jgi:hypothetical protein
VLWLSPKLLAAAGAVKCGSSPPEMSYIESVAADTAMAQIFTLWKQFSGLLCYLVAPTTSFATHQGTYNVQ